ncbi:MAG TPA: YciI family protein [Burkholderiales bacterium]|nr:YciI family protein [Burkholderiales bacterium]
MNWLIVLRPTRVGMLTEGATAEESAAVARHFAYLERLAAEGKVGLAGRTTEDDDRTIGLVLLSASSEEEAREIMANDPAVAQGVMRAELHPFRVAVTKS